MSLALAQASIARLPNWPSSRNFKGPGLFKLAKEKRLNTAEPLITQQLQRTWPHRRVDSQTVSDEDCRWGDVCLVEMFIIHDAILETVRRWLFDPKKFACRHMRCAQGVYKNVYFAHWNIFYSHDSPQGRSVGRDRDTRRCTADGGQR
jgi:hypothetical protein